MKIRQASCYSDFWRIVKSSENCSNVLLLNVHRVTAKFSFDINFP